LIGDTLSSKIANYSGYSHVGYMRYLSDIKAGQYEDAKLLYSVSFLRRIRGYMFKKGSLKKRSFLDIPNDHSKEIYRKKLQYIAFKRQQLK
ncbi:MAG: hypothetical protein HRT43_04840, partial [Campylobacteraceae bacterium]|nr:hypothetical protein [Campylobacteraceae bacterium]